MEWTEVVKIAVGLGAVGFFVWLLMPSRGTAAAEAQARAAREEDGATAAQMGVGTGLAGGGIEDAAIARYALSRTPRDPDSTPERDLGTAIGMQNIPGA